MTSADVSRALHITAAVAETIRELGEVPEGHVYAAVMHVTTLSGFQSCISVLERAKLVKRSGHHLLTWIGPKVGG